MPPDTGSPSPARHSLPRCDICGKNPVEMVINDVSKAGQTTELHVCGPCARERGLVVPPPEKATTSEILEELQSTPQDSDAALTCPHCRMSYAEFKKTLRLGCSECYVAFAERLNPTIRRIHGSLRHAGRVPQGNGNAAREFEIQRLRRELTQAVTREDYERAAAVRDQLQRAGGVVQEEDDQAPTTNE